MEFSSQSWELPTFVTSSFKGIRGAVGAKPHEQEKQDLNLHLKIFPLNDQVQWKLSKTDPAGNESPRGWGGIRMHSPHSGIQQHHEVPRE